MTRTKNKRKPLSMRRDLTLLSLLIASAAGFAPLAAPRVTGTSSIQTCRVSAPVVAKTAAERPPRADGI